MVKNAWVVVSCLVLQSLSLMGQHAETPAGAALEKVPQWGRFEATFEYPGRLPNDPYKDVDLMVTLSGPDGEVLEWWGFYDGGTTWKVRFSPHQAGVWKYEARFSGSGDAVHRGSFRCVVTDLPGQINKYQHNPFWFGHRDGRPAALRSFHVGDHFFARNWDDPENETDGNKRTVLLDWLQQRGYNMVSVASHYLKRDARGRGAGADIPPLWPLDYRAYQYMERILDDLHQRQMIVFPFAGFFGNQAKWPLDADERERYVRYTLARIGFYSNIMLNVAGPEPLYRKGENQYQGGMRLDDIRNIGAMIDRLDVHQHLLTVHQEKRATEFGDPFLHEPWYDVSTLQGPTTTDLNRLYSGLVMNHHARKPLYAQETLWTGNKNHPDYSDEQLRKNALTILFSGAVLNFADNNGNSSSGFSGTLDVNDAATNRHNIVKSAWDFFEGIPFYELIPRQDLVDNGFCLAREGQDYYVYLPVGDEVNLFVDYPYAFEAEWINPTRPTEKINAGMVSGETLFRKPDAVGDWVLHVFTGAPNVVATGNFPDLETDHQGNLHLAYNNKGLRYKRFDMAAGVWSGEESPGCDCANVKRSDPDIVVDSKNNPHVFCGTDYARWNGRKWVKIDPAVTRDTELAIDSKDNVYVIHRGGNNGGHVGLKKLSARASKWETLTDPDQKDPGKNNHVYGDLWIDSMDHLHVVHRHGSVKEVTYRQSRDGGASWSSAEGVSDDRVEGPHIGGVNDVPVIVTGSGLLYRKDGDTWVKSALAWGGRRREQPDLMADRLNNLYVIGFGGKYVIERAYGSAITGQLRSVTGRDIGFVQMAPGGDDFVYLAWEEGDGDPDNGLSDQSRIFAARLYHDGRVVSLQAIKTEEP